MIETAAANAGIVTLTLMSSPLGSSTSSLSPMSSVASPPPPAPPPMPSSSLPLQVHGLQQPAPGKDKNRKKSKSKSQAKTRTIKFHEYKGPPSAHKSQNLNANSAETSYELLLQQQQLFLQWQLEWQQKVSDPSPLSPFNRFPSISLFANSFSMLCRFFKFYYFLVFLIVPSTYTARPTA